MSEPLDHDTLVSVLKEKTKEVNILTKKVSKLEERYVNKHRENSELLTERGVLAGFISTVLEKTVANEPGKLIVEDLEAAWASKEEETSRILRAITANASEEVQKVRTELKALKEQLQSSSSQLCEFSALEEEHLTLLRNNEERKAETEFLEKQLVVLRLDNARLKAQQEQWSTLKTNSLIAILEQSSAENSDEVPKLQKQLIEANNLISLLETQLEDQRGLSDRGEESFTLIEELSIVNAKYSLQLEEQENALKLIREDMRDHRRKAQKLLLEKEQDLERLKNKLKQISSASENEEIVHLKIKLLEVEKLQTKESVNMEYLKNIVIRFMEYMYTGNIKEATTVAYAIYTVLEFSEEEVKLIRTAREASRIYSTVTGLFVAKSPGVGLSHNALRTLEVRKRLNESNMS